jgi:hypothetical protein
MKDLYIQALHNTFNSIVKNSQKTRKKLMELCIDNVKPKDLQKFLEDNNVPDNAFFGIYGDDYDGHSISVTWEIEVPLTEEEQLISEEAAFNNWFYRYVSKEFAKNGYKIKLENYKKNKRSLYSLYINKEYDEAASLLSSWYNVEKMQTLS